MIAERNDGGPAFGHGDPTHGGNEGMSLRDYFAGQALAGFAVYDAGAPQFTPDDAARHAYLWADAMLAARKAGG